MAQSGQLARQIQNGEYDYTFKKLYPNSTKSVAAQRERYVFALKKFEERFGAGRTVRIYSAPGRTEIGGNHTDHNNGIVMAAAVNLDVIAVVSANDQNVVRVASHGYRKTDVIRLDDLQPQEPETGHSASLIRGVANGIVQRGGRIGGFDAFTMSDVLRGSGLSSSAAFEVVIGAAFRGEYNRGLPQLDQEQLAKIGQYAENVYFNKPCGLMDQMASAVGGAITIDFENPEHPVVKKMRMNLEEHGFRLCVSDTKGSHSDLTEDYAAIRTEMEQVANCFSQQVLRGVDEAEFFENIALVRERAGDRAALRAIHFFGECARVGKLRCAIEEDRFEDFLQLIVESGHSSFEYNQNAYSIRTPREQGVALGLALSQRLLDGRGAWRLQGGGFAGTIQAFVPEQLLTEYRGEMEKTFGEGVCYVLGIRNYGAIEVTAAL